MRMAKSTEGCTPECTHRYKAEREKEETGDKKGSKENKHVSTIFIK